MIMKKILVMSALVAISTAFVACSNENDLVQQKPDVPEEPVVGYPMHVTVADTRGTDLTKATLPGFTMYSAMLTPNSGTDWQTGIAFTNNNGACATTGDSAFPDETNTYYFFAISDPGNIADIAEDEGKGNGHPDVPVISNSGKTFSFNYAIPTDYTTYKDGEEIKAANIEDGQRDLLVASATGTGADGNVSVPFTHALALIKNVYVRGNAAAWCAANDLEADAMDTYKFKVANLQICDVNSAATYTIDLNTPANTGWSAWQTPATFDFPIVQSGQINLHADWTALTKATADDGLYLIPQTLNGARATSDGEVFTLSGAYAKIGLQIFDDDSETYKLSANGYVEANGGLTGDGAEASAEKGFADFYVPLSFTINPDKTYGLYLDLYKGVVHLPTDTDGEYHLIFQGMEVVIN